MKEIVRKMSMAMTIAMVATCVRGAVSVSDVSFTQQAGGNVQIDYTVACDTPDADVWVIPVGFDNDRKLSVNLQTLSGDAVADAAEDDASKPRLFKV